MQTCRAHADTCPKYKSTTGGQWAMWIDVVEGLVQCHEQVQVPS